MENLPPYIGIVFILTTLLSLWFFYRASQGSKTSLVVLLLWLALQAYVGSTGFYADFSSLPPRFIFLVVPPFLLIAFLFMTSTGRLYIDGLDLKTLTLLHMVRIPVEIVLFWLFVNKTIPELMTFEGRNFDILSGISAPVIYYFGFVKNKLSKTMLLAWNFICLALLFNIVIHAVLSLPVPFQQFAFEQPNIAVVYFPFLWLPCCVVPLVLFSHLVAIRRLTRH